ncbi:hypothetical protein GOBAR_AA25334 [Gossypium barbadense]|uniref:Uncharacterized protein n=1 Tax=Gossypium barbadense TaxID=3634 RepID=A0A2P5WW71_GOSBA|nr:hypothetical protein GOBAR_AA25334 [Gossypium barbadense]
MWVDPPMSKPPGQNQTFSSVAGAFDLLTPIPEVERARFREDLSRYYLSNVSWAIIGKLIAHSCVRDNKVARAYPYLGIILFVKEARPFVHRECSSDSLARLSGDQNKGGTSVYKLIFKTLVFSAKDMTGVNTSSLDEGRDASHALFCGLDGKRGALDVGVTAGLSLETALGLAFLPPAQALYRLGTRNGSFDLSILPHGYYGVSMNEGDISGWFVESNEAIEIVSSVHRRNFRRSLRHKTSLRTSKKRCIDIFLRTYDRVVSLIGSVPIMSQAAVSGQRKPPSFLTIVIGSSSRWPSHYKKKMAKLWFQGLVPY